MEQIAENIEMDVSENDESENDQPVHVIPEIDIKKNFFDFTSGESNQLTLRLTEAGIIVDDNINQKNISYQSLLNALSDEVSLSTDVLPVIGSDYIAVKKYIVSKNKHILLVESSPKVRTIVYNKTGEEKDKLYYSIPFPGLLFCAVLTTQSNGTFKFDKDASRMYALKTPILNEQTIVYKYPYTNVYGDARICWGNSLEFLRDNSKINVSQIGGLLEVFIGSENNEDLFYSSQCPIPKAENAKQMFEKAQELKTYPYDTLVKQLTFKEVVSLLTNN